MGVQIIARPANIVYITICKITSFYTRTGKLSLTQSHVSYSPQQKYGSILIQLFVLLWWSQRWRWSPAAAATAAAVSSAAKVISLFFFALHFPSRSSVSSGSAPAHSADRGTRAAVFPHLKLCSDNLAQERSLLSAVVHEQLLSWHMWICITFYVFGSCFNLRGRGSQQQETVQHNLSHLFHMVQFK